MSFAGAHIGTSTGDKRMAHIQHDPYDVAFLLGPGSGRAELHIGMRDVCVSDTPTHDPSRTNGSVDQQPLVIETIHTISLTMTQDPRVPDLTHFEFKTKRNPGLQEIDQGDDVSIAISRARHALMTLRHYVEWLNMFGDSGLQHKHIPDTQIRHNYLPPGRPYQMTHIEQLRQCVFPPSTADDFTRFVQRTGISFADIDEISRIVEVAAEIQDPHLGPLGPEGVTGIIRNTWPYLEGRFPLAVKEAPFQHELNRYHGAAERR